MRNVPPDKYNVAWFKLAECVSRGEKERALGVYRLLAHSLHDPAFARQLQGDILLSFNDQAGAIEHYCTAARLYQEDKRLLESAAIYEHVVTMVPDKQYYLTMLVELYRALRMKAKALVHATSLCALSLAQDKLDDALAVIEQLDAVFEPHEIMPLRQQLVFALLQKNNIPSGMVIPHIEQVVHCLMQDKDATALQRFLVAIQAIDATYYTQACAYMKEAQ